MRVPARPAVRRRSGQPGHAFRSLARIGYATCAAAIRAAGRGRCKYRVMRSQPLEYRHDDTLMIGELVHDDARPERRPGVLVFPEGTGLGEHPLQRARQLAELGYVALACDMYGGRQVAPSMQEARPMLAALRADPARLRARARAGLEALRARPEVDGARVGAIGFCFGGMTVLELARDGADLLGVVSFHGILKTALPAQAGN